MKSSWRSGGIFMAASVLAGLLNYLFQVVAARQLSSADFAALNGWFANLSIFFFAGGLLQYAGNFWPPKKPLLRAATVLVNLLALIALAYWFTSPGVLTFDRALFILALSTIFGWIQGQAQIRMAFGVLAAVNLAMAAAKLGLTAAPIGEPQELTRYAFALFFSFLPGLWILAVYLWLTPPAGQPAVKPAWSAPVVLSLATAILPQFDMVLMSHTQTPTDFAEFVHASLFARSIYFLMFIVAQWLLPQQILNARTKVVRAFPKIFAVAALATLALTMVSPWISINLMKWEAAPTYLLVALSCLHMSLLTLVYLQIQESAAKGQIPFAAVCLITLALEAAVQMVLQLPAVSYFALVLTLQAALMTALWHRQK